MYSNVFFSIPGKGYFKATPPKNIEKCSQEVLANWASTQIAEHGYKDFQVTENPNPEIPLMEQAL